MNNYVARKHLNYDQDTEDIISLFEILEFGQNEAKTASTVYRKLKQKNQIIETADILIVATAL